MSKQNNQSNKAPSFVEKIKSLQEDAVPPVADDAQVVPAVEETAPVAEVTESEVVPPVVENMTLELRHQPPVSEIPPPNNRFESRPKPKFTKDQGDLIVSEANKLLASYKKGRKIQYFLKVEGDGVTTNLEIHEPQIQAGKAMCDHPNVLVDLAERLEACTIEAIEEYIEDVIRFTAE